MPPAASVSGGVRAALVVVSALLFLEALGARRDRRLAGRRPRHAAAVVVRDGDRAHRARRDRRRWVGAVAIASLRRAHWSRAAAIVWQILQISIAVGAFQGLFARPDVGWLLLVPAITVIGLLLWTPVRLAYTRAGDADRAPDGA